MAPEIVAKEIFKESSLEVSVLVLLNRLYWPSLQYMTTEQNSTFYKDIQEAEHLNVCILTGKDGWPFDLTKEDNHMKVALDTLQPKTMKELPGSHHFHMDPESCEQVATSIVEFLTAA